MRDQPFGVEIEMTGVTRQQAAEALAGVWNGQCQHTGGSYDAWTVIDPQGKEWKLMSDGSIRAERWIREKEYDRINDSKYCVEMVTPKLEYAEVPKLQVATRALRAIHAKVNDSCGLHVHVDASRHDTQSLKNLMSIMYSKEDLLFDALKVPEGRVQRWCRPVRENTLQQVRRMSPSASMNRLQQIWYDGRPNIHEHYHDTRYHALNLHSLFYRDRKSVV